MYDDRLQPMPVGQRPQLIAVIDTCVLVVVHHMQRILDAARDGYLLPIWSPLILSEANRVLTWKWLRARLRRQGQSGSTITLTPAIERDCSVSAKAWFGIMTEVFRVVEDRPPHEPLWTGTPRDPDDVPIWNAAVRSGAHFVVTSNLSDGPPLDTDGRRTFDGIACVSPEEFAVMLAWWATMISTGDQPDATDSIQVAPAYRGFLEDLMSREVARLDAPDA